jgi:putative hydrolase of HD superfamily
MQISGPEDGILRFWALAQQLKSVRRQGWIDRGVEQPESSADHSWGVALLAWLLAHDRPELDRERVLLLGLVHDLPEAVAGDATPFDLFRDASGAITQDRFHQLPEYSLSARDAKTAAEEDALATMVGSLSPDLANSIRAVWSEYEAATTPESRFVHQIDKLETLLQAEEYAWQQPDIIIESFRSGTRRDVTDAELRPLIDLAQHRRNH